MTNSGVGRDNQEIVERLLRPPQQLVALPVSAELQARVDAERVGTGEHVRDHRVIDHQLRGDQRVDRGRVPAERGHCISHRDRSTTHGTPVKSCINTLAGVNWISVPLCRTGSTRPMPALGRR